jgi:hypothetical protein
MIAFAISIASVYLVAIGVLRLHFRHQLRALNRPANAMLVVGWFQRLLCFFFHHEDIVKDIDGQQSLYLRRWFLWGWSPISKDPRPRRGVYLHWFCRSDDDRDPHDHPWDFRTLVLWGGYVDEQWNSFDNNGFNGRWVNGYEPMGFLAYRLRKAEHLHRVQLMPGRTSWSLLFISPKRRGWGFYTPNGWVGWRDYFGAGASSIDEQP